MNDQQIEYPYLKNRRGVWQEIAKYIYADIGQIETLVELGPGFCDFVNQYPAKKKICYELNRDMQYWAAPEVIFLNKNAISISEQAMESVDFVFASNFLEHLDNEELAELLPKIYKALKKSGKLVLLQPNYSLCKKKYFEDISHKTIFSDANIVNFLEKFGFVVSKTIPNLLPLQMKSRLPKWPILVKLYLYSPIKPGAGQMYIIAEKE